MRNGFSEERLDRREFLAASVGGVAGLSAASPLAAEAADTAGTEPRNVGDRKQLFIDRRFIAASENVALVMNPAQKLGIVLDSEKEPWEKGTGGYFRVLEDGGKFKLYYGAFTDAGHSVCYAESEDGLHWRKPALGLISVNGSKQNNILIGDNAIDATVMVDPRDAPERRYKLFRSRVANDAGAGVYAAYSADGIHFTDAGRVLPMWPETSLIADWDERVGKYVVFLRVFERDGQNQRRVGRFETDDLLKPWPYKPTEPLRSPPSPANIPQVFAADEKDDPFSDFYTCGVTRYPYAEDVYLMFPSAFRHFTPNHQPFFRFQPGNDDGFIETQMAVSRDGIRWERPDRRPYVPMGLPDEWDRWMSMMGVGMLRKGSYLYQYYWSSGRMHDGGILRPEYDKSISTRSAIGAARQRLDGFMSADFAYGGGSLTTPLMRFSGTELRLNVDAGGMGVLFVELRDAQGKPIPGFTPAECEETGGNFVDAKVRWKGKSDLSALRGQPISLHFSGRNAKLYAFQFATA